jgi:hypothetical protein
MAAYSWNHLMSDLFSLLKALKTPGYDASVMTTFNCYLPFLEEVVIRRLAAIGCRHNLVLADRNQLSAAINSNPPNRSGIDYWLLPIDSSKAFHPKLTLLVGKDKGQLFIGSHNLTYSGFGGNREVTNVITFHKRSNADSLPIFKMAVETMRSWAKRTNAPGVDEAFEQLFELAPWLKENNEVRISSNKLIFGGPGNPALLDQLKEFCGPPIRDIVVSGAFFDEQTQFLKRLQDDFRPQRFIVTVHPETVQLPPSAQTLPDVKFVSAEQLGPDGNDYLHAKFIYLVSQDDQHIFASGSANPSRPAWLDADSSANDEAMLVRLGTDGQAAAASMGIDIQALHSQPALTPEQWDVVESQWSTNQNEAKSAESVPLKYALSVEPGVVKLDTPNLVSDTRFQFLGGSELVLAIDYTTQARGKFTELTFDKDLRIPIIREFADDKIVANHLIHYQTTLEEHARTGAQRKFRTSLASLDADSPELNTLFRCVEQIILDPEIHHRRTARTTIGGQVDGDKKAPDTLEVDIKSIAASTKRKRMSDGTDLGYILDLLIKSLSQPTSDNYSATDGQGRDEEEQIGADDAIEDQEAEGLKNEQQAAKILALCHRKIGQLIRRTQSELNKTIVEKLPIDDVALKLTAILALLRHLKAHEAILWWVNTKRGETAVPSENFRLLCDSVLMFLEAKNSLLTRRSDNQTDLANFEEIGRLKGLVFWLAIEAGRHLNFEGEFNESAERARNRIQNNTDFIALGDIMANDNLAVDEARETIRVTNAAAMTNLQQAIQLHQVIQISKANPAEYVLHPGPGDLAFHPRMIGLGVRSVLSYDENQAQIARLGHGKPRIFGSKNLVYLSLGKIRHELQ